MYFDFQLLVGPKPITLRFCWFGILEKPNHLLSCEPYCTWLHGTQHGYIRSPSNRVHVKAHLSTPSFPQTHRNCRQVRWNQPMFPMRCGLQKRIWQSCRQAQLTNVNGIGRQELSTLACLVPFWPLHSSGSRCPWAHRKTIDMYCYVCLHGTEW